MTDCLMPKNKARALQRFSGFTAGQIGGKLGHELSCVDFDDFLTRLGGYGIARCPAILNVEPDGFANIG